MKPASFAGEHFADHNWRGIRDLGNLLRHDYPDVLDAIVWKIITTDLPPCSLNRRLSWRNILKIRKRLSE